MPTDSDPDLQLRVAHNAVSGKLREMLPGSVVRTQTRLWAAQLSCADRQKFAYQYQISVLVDGQPKTFNIPATLVEQVRQKIKLRHRFEIAATTICKINLTSLLKEKEKP